jgi:opacity protein-like surface antigen
MMSETSFQWGFGLSYTFKDEAEDEEYRYKDTWTIFLDYTANVKDASITPTKLYYYHDSSIGEDSNYYDKMSVEGLTVGVLYNF